MNGLVHDHGDAMTLDSRSEKDHLKSLGDWLARYSALAADELIRRGEGGDVQCFACGHRCLVKPGRDGVCRVRFNENGQLRVPFGYVAGVACDPIEKKPLWHVLPGSDALTFGMLGCDLHCGYCQNWITSQMLRDPASMGHVKRCKPEDLVNAALQHQAPVMVSSYNEPLITSEWAVAVFKAAKVHGLKCAYVSNGNATPEVLDYMRPFMDAYKVDLKTFNDKNYRQLGGVLENVTTTIRLLKERGFWVEVVTLVVPGFSDDADDLKRMAEFLASVDPLMPWHMTAFHPDYKMRDRRNTTADDLMKVLEIGRQAGLKYLYPGNLHGMVGGWEDTQCHRCSATLVRRTGFRVHENRVGSDGLCPECKAAIPGIWGKSSGHGDGRIRHIA